MAAAARLDMLVVQINRVVIDQSGFGVHLKPVLTLVGHFIDHLSR